MKILSVQHLDDVRKYFASFAEKKAEKAVEKKVEKYAGKIVGKIIGKIAGIIGVHIADEPINLLGEELDVDEFIDKVLNPVGEGILFNKISLIKVSYQSTDPTGENPATLSGLLIIPQDNGKASSPIMGYQHGTTLTRNLAPSYFELSKPPSENNSEVLIAILLSSTNGSIIAMADYQGLGDDESHVQPYVCAKPLAQSAGDLLLETKAYVEEQKDLYWNKQIFLIGYSQGGYVTMAACREIQENPKYAGLHPLTATAPGAGPYSLSGAMRFVILRKEAYSQPFFFPMVIRGFNAMYGDEYGNGIFTKKKAFKPEYWKLWDLVDGTHSFQEVNAAMPPVPRAVFSKEMIAQFSNEKSPAYQALADNDLFDWEPKTPMQLYQCPDDDLVPFGNSVAACDSFKSKGISVALVPMFYSPMKTMTHVGAGVPCLSAAYDWLNTFRNKHTAVLEPGDFLYGGKNLYSHNRQYCLRYQLDGNLVFYCTNNIELLWEAGIKSAPGICIIQENGEFVVYDLSGKKQWSANTDHNPGDKVIVSDDGKLLIKDKSGKVVLIVNC